MNGTVKSRLFPCNPARAQPWSEAALLSLEMLSTPSRPEEWRKGEGMCDGCILTSWTKSCYINSHHLSSLYLTL